MYRIVMILLFMVLALNINAQRCEHKVLRGEDFNSIAEKYGITVEELMEANPASKACYIGRKLQIPYHGVPVQQKEPEVAPFDYGLISSTDKVLTKSADATFQVGQALIKAKKYEEAHAYLALAADSGEVRAYYPLGLYYSQEDSKGRDNDLAALYFSKAAASIKDKTMLEYWHSCGYLAEYFLDGKFVQKDLKEAKHFGEEYQQYAIGDFKNHAKSLMAKIRNEEEAVAREERAKQAELKRRQIEEERQRKQVAAQQKTKTKKLKESDYKKMYIAANTQTTSVPATTSNTTSSNNSQGSGNALQPYTVSNYFGGQATYYPQADGSVKVYTKTACTFCRGTKRCDGCRYNAMYNSVASMPRICPMCMGTTICSRCKGSGYQESWSFLDGNGNGYSIDSRGNVMTSAEAKVLNTRVSTSSGNNTASKKEEKKNEPFDFIKYGPNYTGETTYKWCDKCNKYVFSEHYHSPR